MSRHLSRAQREALQHPLAERGFALDMAALTNRSAHLELGYAAGAGKPTAGLPLARPGGAP